MADIEIADLPAAEGGFEGLREVRASEQLYFSTVRLGCTHTDGRSSWGTGYFLELPRRGRAFKVVVTAKHVLADLRSVTVTLHLRDEGETKPNGRIAHITATALELLVHEHPEYDLAVFPAAILDSTAAGEGVHIYHNVFSEAHLPTREQLGQLDGAEDVYVPGYPDGMWDFHNNSPLLRKGSTASAPIVDFMGDAQMAVDIPVVKGSSGSPIVLVGSRRDPDLLLLLGTLIRGRAMTVDAEDAARGLLIHIGYGIKAASAKRLVDELWEILRTMTDVD